MPTIAHIDRAETGRLDHVGPPIGPTDGPGPVPDLAAVLADLADRGHPRDTEGVEALRAVARAALASLPGGHPLAGIDVADDSAVLLVRLVARLARDLRVGCGWAADRRTPAPTRISEGRGPR